MKLLTTISSDAMPRVRKLLRKPKLTMTIATLEMIYIEEDVSVVILGASEYQLQLGFFDGNARLKSVL